MKHSLPSLWTPGVLSRRIVISVIGTLVLYVLAAGPMTRYAPEFADWMYTPLAPLANVSPFGSLLRDWVALWGVDVGE